MITINQAIEECLQALQNKKSDNTVRTYREGYDIFLEFLGNITDLSTEQLTPNYFIDFPTYLVSKYENKKSAMNREAAVKYLRKWLKHKRYITFDDNNENDYNFAKSDAFSEREFSLPKFIPDADIEKAIEFVPNMDTYYPIERLRNVAIVYTLASSGIRVDGLSKLLVGDIDLVEGKVFVRRGKGRKAAFSPLSKKAIEAIKLYWSGREWSAKDDPAFARHDKQASDDHLSFGVGGIQAMIRDLREQAGVSGLTAHKFRHYVGTKVTKKFGIRVAQEWLHHSDIQTTQGYSHILDQDVMEAADELFGGD